MSETTTEIETLSISNITTEIETLSISSAGRNNDLPISMTGSDTITQQPQSANVESTTLPASAPIRKWRWPKPSERRKKAGTLQTHTHTNTHILPPSQTPSEWTRGNELPQSSSQNRTPSSSSSAPVLSLTQGFENYWEDISDEEMTTYIPSNIITIWKSVIAQKRAQARAAGVEYERELEEEIEEKYGGILRCGWEKNREEENGQEEDRQERNRDREALVEGLLEMVEECGLFGLVRERGRRAFWEGDGVE
ncbi:uncharacterized protein EAF01_010563 [Botrytis porri]|uniref:Uncharacterized protein n=1 Tax=Botrytis porri TaxID=87229 RepID=A0A4Z1KNV2_9HELO|nr:uncharacterized protein EAF01_010563 [Botrytis porri]KAF7890754.1 hypothetical protein EAF01_010563 [Botrytis porri]TGO86012.1 hypothetical protein BPOR_0343g00060 [Botrytis porri]